MAQSSRLTRAQRIGAVVFVGMLTVLTVVRFLLEENRTQGVVEPSQAPVSVDKLDVNTADSADFVRLTGIGPRMAARIVRYRSKIGGFRTWDDLAHVYGMDTLLPRLRPYLILEEAAAVSKPAATAPVLKPPSRGLSLNTATAEQVVATRVLPDRQARQLIRFRDACGGFRDWQQVARTRGLAQTQVDSLRAWFTLPSTPAPESRPAAPRRLAMVDLNAADSAALEALPGIGPVLARRIVAYRMRLGYYQSVEQLREVKGLNDSLWQKCTPRLVVDTTGKHAAALDLNAATEAELARHPYIGGALARRIVKYREQHGRFWAMADLKRIVGVTEAQVAILQGYLRIP